MNSILKWLHNNDGLVHMLVMLSVFYGIPVAAFSVLYPNLVEPLTNSALVGLTLVFLLFISYRAASAATDAIKNAVTRVTLDQMRDAAAKVNKIEKDAIVDYSSPNMLVVSSEEKKSSQKTVDAPVDALVEKKKRGPKAKSVKKES